MVRAFIPIILYNLALASYNSVHDNNNNILLLIWLMYYVVTYVMQLLITVCCALVYACYVIEVLF